MGEVKTDEDETETETEEEEWELPDNWWSIWAKNLIKERVYEDSN